MSLVNSVADVCSQNSKFRLFNDKMTSFSTSMSFNVFIFCVILHIVEKSRDISVAYPGVARYKDFLMLDNERKEKATVEYKSYDKFKYW